MKKSRRRFLKVVAAGAAAAMVAPSSALAAAAKPAKRAAKPAPRPAARPDTALAAEIARQQGALAQTLKVLREFPLENGDDQAFAFQPLRAPRAER